MAISRTLDFAKIGARTKNEKEVKFLEIFQQTPTVVYNWGSGITWVIDGTEEEAKKDPARWHGMYDDRFLEELGETDFLTSADVVVVLLCNGKNVEIENCGGYLLHEKWILDIRSEVEKFTGREAPRLTIRS